jgi:hypothetical protein
MHDHYVLPIHNMGLTAKKYGVLVSFSPKLAIFGKTVALHLWILSEKLKILRTRKNLYTGPLCIIDPE